MTSGTGTDALDRLFSQHFPGAAQHVVLMTGADPDGFEAVKAVRDAERHCWCLITYGISDLGEKKRTHPALSGFGYELTLRAPESGESLPPDWAIVLLNNLARYLRPRRYDVLDDEPLMFNEPIAPGVSTALTAIMFADDVQFGNGIDTPNGYVQFRQVVGITQDEGMYQAGFGRARLREKLVASNPLLLTLLNRPSVLPPLA
jgi:hypothetical protein